MNNHYLYLANNFKPADFNFLDDGVFSNTLILSDPCEYLIYFANLSEKEKEALIECFEGAEGYTDLREYADNAYKKVAAICGKEKADIIFLDLENDISNFYLDEAEDALRISLNNVCQWAYSYCDMLCAVSSEEDSEERREKLIKIVLEINPQRQSNIVCYPTAVISKKTGKLSAKNIYEISNTWDAMRLFFLDALMEKKIISRCKLCHKYFAPASRSDEVYCVKCRAKSYDSKIDDEVQREYRKIYKTQYARRTANKQRHNIKENFEEWAEYAKRQLTACKNQEITFEEMRENISSTDWIYKK